MATLRELLRKLVGVEVVLDGVEYPNNYADDLSIDRTNLEEEFLSHAERYAYYATLAEMADERATRMKEEMAELSARLDHDIRASAENIRITDPKFKMTETMVANEILLRKEYKDKQKELQEARHLSTILSYAPMAFAHRRDMLIELSKTHMSTLSDPRITGGKQQQVKNMFAQKGSGAPTLPPPEPEPETIAQGSPTGTLCSVCREPQYVTPHGVVCDNGHGGAEPLVEPPPQAKPIAGRRRAARPA